MLNRLSAQARWIHSRLAQVVNRFRTEEFAANLVVRLPLALDEHNFLTGLCQPKRRHRAGKASPDDEVLDDRLGGVQSGFLRLTHRRAGL